MKVQILFVGAFLFLLFYACKNPNDHTKSSDSGTPRDSISEELGHGYDFVGNGKIASQSLDSIFTPTDIDTFPIAEYSDDLLKSLALQLKLLSRKKNFVKNVSGQEISKNDIETTIKHLISSQNEHDSNIEDSLIAYQLYGEDGRGNVHYTGYFTPVLEVRAKQDSIFNYPLYRFPSKWSGPLPSRKEIDSEGALQDKDLEIAFAKSKLDVYFMHVQGSGIVEFEDGKTMLLAHAGSNNRAYKSIGKYMIEQGLTTKEKVSLKSIQNYFKEHPDQLDGILNINASYIFFVPQKSQPYGAGNIPLTPYHSIAVDKDVIPLGSCLLGSVPILDENRNFSHHEYRILIAQDVGGAINGPGHIDLYTGIGRSAKNAASNLHHYGRLWLLLPKK